MPFEFYQKDAASEQLVRQVCHISRTRSALAASSFGSCRQTRSRCLREKILSAQGRNLLTHGDDGEPRIPDVFRQYLGELPATLGRIANLNSVKLSNYNKLCVNSLDFADWGSL
jgi:hypothetical protein